MSKDSYNVHPVKLNTLHDYEVLVLELPEGELDDKLTYLAREGGKISRSLYEDFVISNCVANINQLLSYINQNMTNSTNFIQIREELMDALLKYNPLLSPDKLVINKNHVVKVMQTKKPRADEKFLTENPDWGKSYYEDLEKLKDNLTNDTATDDEATKTKLRDKANETSRDITDLEFETQEVWWKRIGQYVKIKKFKKEDAVHILKKRFFHSSTSFNTFIVSVCVVDFEDLFALLDNMGIPSRVAPPILMNELYELCRDLNPFLTFENAQDLAGDDDSPEEGGKPRKPYRTTAGNMSDYAKKEKTKKSFKDVPKEELLQLAERMKVFLIGQDEAIDTMVDAIQRASIGLKDPNRPIGSFLFAGRTGVGKTLATKILADELIKDPNNLVTIDCSEYSADHEYAKLIGAPSGYIGHDQGGHLTNAIMNNPFSVVVFDEVEKASHKVHELMLQILEEGRLTDGKGQKVSFKDTVVIMTSNVGAKEINAISSTIGFGDASKITEDKKDTALKTALKKKFKPEFLNRIDAIVNFKTLSKENYMRIIDIELFKLNENLKYNDTEYKDLKLVFDDSVKKYIYKNGIDEDYGARPLKRCIERRIATPMAREILAMEDLNCEQTEVVVSFKRNKVKFDFKCTVEEVPEYLEEENGGSDGSE